MSGSASTQNNESNGATHIHYPPIVGKNRFCESCGAALSDNAKFCACCGSETGLLMQQSEPMKCPHCGKNTAQEDKFCMHCGKNL